ncbi:hypothetical protein AAF712_015663 [Marasmius tenuissimus]|uniref:WD40 repeat-like protein n=1 Tax=Marasmius tenuissimus TaxID=585030 RepID=A0ABR2Z8K7_9AGAR
MFFNQESTSSPTPAIKYDLYATLSGSSDAILSLSPSYQSQFLAVAGYGGLSIWDLTVGSKPETVAVPRGYVSPDPRDGKHLIGVSKWLFFECGSRHVLVLGGLHGQVVLLTLDSGRRYFELWHELHTTTTSQVVSVDVRETFVCQSTFGYVAFVHEDRTYACWRISATESPMKVFTGSLPSSLLPLHIQFDKNRNLYAFAHLGGDIVQLHKATGQEIWKGNSGLNRMNGVVVDMKNGRFLAATSKDYQAHSFPGLSRHQRTFKRVTPISIHYCTQLALLEDGKRVVAGTDADYAVIYRIDSSEPEQILEYPKGGLVQTVTGFHDDNYEYVAMAGSTAEEPSHVLLFRKERPKPKAQSEVSATARSGRPKWFYTCLVLLGLVAMSLLISRLESARLTVWRSDPLDSLFPSFTGPRVDMYKLDRNMDSAGRRTGDDEYYERFEQQMVRWAEKNNLGNLDQLLAANGLMKGESTASVRTDD